MANDAQRFKLPQPPHRVSRPAAKFVGLLLLAAFPALAIIEGKDLMLLLPASMMPPVVWAAYLCFAEVRYVEVSRGRLRIIYRLRRRTIPFKDITAWERLGKPSAASLYGPGFSLHAVREQMSRQHGPLDVIATTITDFILIRVRGKPSLLVGPDDADGFVRAIESAGITRAKAVPQPPPNA